MRSLKYLLPFFFLGAILLSLAGCKEEMVPAGVEGYKHIPWGEGGISGFAVNGRSFFIPGYQCCVSLPRKWRPGLKAKIDWVVYLPRPGEPGENDPHTYSEVVDIPHYRPEEAEGFRVHFYPDHKVKVIVTRHMIANPFYPMKKEEQLPFKADPHVVSRFRQAPDLMGKGATDEDWEWARQWGLDKDELFDNFNKSALSSEEP
jgi:hypothetical protein